jgi:hypothetical protein
MPPDAEREAQAQGPDTDASDPMRTPVSHEVFVSYSTRDKPVADAIVARLEQAGIRCWIAPRDVLPGRVWGEAIVEAIGSTRLMVIVLSGESNHSPQVVREVERAVAAGLVVVPFRIEEIEPTGAMAYFLASEHWLDAMTPPLEAHVSHLTEVVQALLDTTGTTPAPRPAPTPAPADAARAPARRKWRWAAAAVALVAIGGTALAIRGPAPETAPAEVAARSVPLEGLTANDCLVTPAEFARDDEDQLRFWREDFPWQGRLATRGLSRVDVVPCDQPHGAEVYFQDNLWPPDAAPYPGVDEASRERDARCAEAFESYVGIPPGRSGLDTAGWIPGQASWADGDRQISCIAYDASGRTLTETVRGSER